MQVLKCTQTNEQSLKINQLKILWYAKHPNIPETNYTLFESIKVHNKIIKSLWETQTKQQ